MEKERVICTNVNELMILCQILDEFENFNKNAVIFFSGNDKVKSVNKLYKIIKNEPCSNSRKVRKFYNDNKKVIDIISKYLYIPDFFLDKYCCETEGNKELNYMYNYIKDNRKDLDKIITVIERIKQLGIYKVEFNENFDFTEDRYKFWTKMYYNGTFYYLDNLEYVPTCDSDVIEYKSIKSNYMIECEYDELISNKIKINSLIFDYKCLPETIGIDVIYDKLVKLRETKKGEYNVLRNLVDLNIVLDEIENITLKMNNVVDKIDTVKTKEELKLILNSIKENIDKFENKTEKYEQESLGKCKSITHATIIQEKELKKTRLKKSY